MGDLLSAASAHRRVRWAMYTLLAAVALHAALQAWLTERAHAIRRADVQLADMAGAQRMLSQRIGGLATLIGAEPGTATHREALRATLEQSDADAARLLRGLATAGVDGEAASLSAARQRWSDSRAALVQRARALLDPGMRDTPGRAEHEARAVRSLADPALAASQQLVDALERNARARDGRDTTRARWGAAAALLLVLGLALGVAEPTVRAVRAQYRRISEQSAEVRRLALVARLTTNAVMITDADQRIVWVNDAFCRVTGFQPDEARGQRPGELLHHERVDAATYARFRAALDAGQGVRAQFLNRRKDGQDLWLDVDTQPLRDAGGRLTGFVDVATDITQRRQAAAELRIAAIAFDSLEAIAITDAEQVILKVNPAFTRITGYTSEEACGRITGTLLRSGLHDGAFYAAMWQSLERDRHWQGEVWNRRKNGEIYPEWLSITAVTDEDNRVTNFVAAFTDITEKKRADELIHRLAFYDPLTELPNRRLLKDRLEQALASSARHRSHVAVLFIDLDRFKALNDSLGHDLGDRLLVEVAHRLKACVRENDTVSRQGGDEFVVVLSDLGATRASAASQAQVVVQKIREAIGRPFVLGAVQWRCTPSIGVALGLGHTSTADELLKQADTAMYEAKRAGRGDDPSRHAGFAGTLVGRVGIEPTTKGL